MHFSSSHTSNFLIILTRGKCLKDTQQTVLRSIGNVFQISAPTYIKQRFRFGSTNFLSPRQVHPPTPGAQTPVLPPPFTQPHRGPSPQKREGSLLCAQIYASLPGVSFSKGSLRKHPGGARRLGMLVAVICNLTLVHSSSEACCPFIGFKCSAHRI